MTHTVREMMDQAVQSSSLSAVPSSWRKRQARPPLSFLVAFSTIGLAAACAGRTADDTMGAGSVTTSGGGGGAAGGPVCVPGQQLACACGGSLTGWQVCNADGTAFLACHCDEDGAVGQSDGQGGAAADASSADTARPDANESGVDASHPYDAPAADAQVADTSAPDSSSDAKRYADDPCPATTGEFVNCSTTCDGQRTCDESLCPNLLATVRVAGGTKAAPAIVRTPSGLLPLHKCNDCPTPIYAFVIRSTRVGATIAVGVDPPWNVARQAASGIYRYCEITAACTEWSGDVVVFTREPDAPARNVRVAELTTCNDIGF
jgi:hypothetical protein